MAKWGVRSGTAALLLLVALVAGALMPAMALGALPFTGGPDQWSNYVLNDHTPVAVHFTADAGSGLATGTTYYVKVRYTVGTSPGSSTNRGYTWNQSAQTWVQERENDWTKFPTVSTDDTGAITGGSGWVFSKFGDDTKSGQYHLMISLSSGVASTTYNCSFVPTVTVLDPRTNGSWVHNGIATTKPANKRAAITDVASTTVFALQKTEAQLVDDNSDGIVDNEDYGPAGAAGDFRMGVPAATAIAVNLNQSTWTPANGFVSGAPDVDLAISAADTIAPSAAGPLTCASGDGTASISWTAATDNSAVAGYQIYRWQPAPVGALYSPVHSLLATVSPGQLFYDDTGLTNGATYLYEVRAYDASTNVGPRSNTATGSPFVPKPSAVVSPDDPNGENDWYVTTPAVTLTASGAGRTCVYSFDAVPSVWMSYTAPIEIPNGVSKLTFAETDGSNLSVTSSLDFKVDTQKPTVALSTPAVSVSVSRNRSFLVTWAGTDKTSGVAGYDVDYRVGPTGSWVPWRGSTSARSAVFTGALGSNNYFRARVRDSAGNLSAYTPAKLTIVPFDQTFAAYSGGWSTAVGSSFYLGTARYTTKKGASARLSFTKGTLYLVAKTGPTLGKIAVYYRDVRVGTVNLHSKTTKYRQVFKILSRSSGTTAGTVRLVNVGVSGHRMVQLDGIAIQR